jgi:eukaryotic-like serine/threonine-protein kinase
VTLEEAHRRAGEARALRAQGRTHEAAELFAAAGMSTEAAACYREMGDARRALDCLVRVRADEPRYRAACVAAISLSVELDVAGIDLDALLGRFLADGPKDERERAALYTLAVLNERHGYLEGAREALRRLVADGEPYRDAARLLRQVEQRIGSPLVPDELPDLPALPELPRLPAPLPLAGTPLPSAETAQPVVAQSQPSGMAFVVGATIGDRYLLEERIGQGGMSIVFRAADLDLGERIALKVFTQGVFGPESEGRFKRELLLSRQLVHPNVLRLYDIGFFAGFRYISMELLTGSDLVGRMGTGIPVAEAVGYLIQACDGLQAAHDRSIVHRDIKPGNIFLMSDGTLKLMDFGIAKVQSAPGLTATGAIAGTPAYMAPEQIRDFSGVGPPADLYSLGAVAYEMLVGRPPFWNSDSMAVLMMHLYDKPAPPRSVAPQIPAALEEIVLRLLEKAPAERFASCREVRERLEAVQRTFLR